jgi:hypothetical protein
MITLLEIPLDFINMNKHYFALLVFFIISYPSICQDTLYLSSKQSSRKYTVAIESNSEQGIRRLNIWGGVQLKEDALSFGGVSYYIPKKHLFNVQIGRGINYDGVAILRSFNKEKITNQAIDSEHTVDEKIYYAADVPTVRTQSIGLHYGAGYSSVFSYNDLRSSNFRGGITLIRSRSLKWTSSYGSDERKCHGHRRSTLNLDALYYFNHYDINGELDPADTGVRQFGVSLTFEGYSSSWSTNGHFGPKYLLGVGIGPYNQYWIQAGFGFNFSFL